MVGLAFWCCFFFGLPFQLLQFLRYLKLQAVLPFQQVKKKLHIYINISLACRTLRLRCYLLHTSLPQVCTLTSIFFWLMFFWLEQWPSLKRREFIIYRNLTSNVCIRFGLIVSFMRTVSAPPTPWNSRKKNQSEWRGSTTYHISQKNIYFSIGSWKVL